MSMIDGNTDTLTATVTVGNYPVAVAVNSVTNMVYEINYCGNHPGCNEGAHPPLLANPHKSRCVIRTGQSASATMRYASCTK